MFCLFLKEIEVKWWWPWRRDEQQQGWYVRRDGRQASREGRRGQATEGAWATKGSSSPPRSPCTTAGQGPAAKLAPTSAVSSTAFCKFSGDTLIFKIASSNSPQDTCGVNSNLHIY